MGTGKSGAKEEQQTRGANGVTGVEHCGKPGPIGIRGVENILGSVQIR